MQTSPGGRRRDPLLGTVRFLLSIGMFLAIGLTIVDLVAAPIVLIWREAILSELSRRSGSLLPPQLAYAISGAQVLIAVASLLAFQFIRNLRRIIDTVADGDPFIPANALRLNEMAWLTVAMQFVAVPAGALAGWVSALARTRDFHIGISLSGVLLALILLILARIFRTGAAMRDELEGTV
jgi:hypothetical protein